MAYLYSYKGQPPKELPHRIVLSDGRTRTDSSTFTEEELTDAGWILAGSEPIMGVGPYQKTRWTGSAWVIEDLSDDEMLLKASTKLKQVPSERWQKEIANIRWTDSANNSFIIDCTVESQRKFASVQTAINTGIRTDNDIWKLYSIDNSRIEYRPTLNTEITEISQMVLQKTQIAFNTEKEVVEAILGHIDSADYVSAIETSYETAFNNNIANTDIVIV